MKCRTLLGSTFSNTPCENNIPSSRPTGGRDMLHQPGAPVALIKTMLMNVSESDEAVLHSSIGMLSRRRENVPSYLSIDIDM